MLIGILMMPFMNLMKYLAVKFDNVNLDPSVWITKFGQAYNIMCRESPAMFVRVDFSFFLIFVLL